MSASPSCCSSPLPAVGEAPNITYCGGEKCPRFPSGNTGTTGSLGGVDPGFSFYAKDMATADPVEIRGSFHSLPTWQSQGWLNCSGKHLPPTTPGREGWYFMGVYTYTYCRYDGVITVCDKYERYYTSKVDPSHFQPTGNDKYRDCDQGKGPALYCCCCRSAYDPQPSGSQTQYVGLGGTVDLSASRPNTELLLPEVTEMVGAANGRAQGHITLQYTLTTYKEAQLALNAVGEDGLVIPTSVGFAMNSRWLSTSLLGMTLDTMYTAGDGTDPNRESFLNTTTVGDNRALQTWFDNQLLLHGVENRPLITTDAKYAPLWDERIAPDLRALMAGPVALRQPGGDPNLPTFHVRLVLGPATDRLLRGLPESGWDAQVTKFLQAFLTESETGVAIGCDAIDGQPIECRVADVSRVPLQYTFPAPPPPLAPLTTGDDVFLIGSTVTCTVAFWSPQLYLQAANSPEMVLPTSTQWADLIFNSTGMVPLSTYNPECVYASGDFSDECYRLIGEGCCTTYNRQARHLGDVSDRLLNSDSSPTCACWNSALGPATLNTAGTPLAMCFNINCTEAAVGNSIPPELISDQQCLQECAAFKQWLSTTDPLQLGDFDRARYEGLCGEIAVPGSKWETHGSTLGLAVVVSAAAVLVGLGVAAALSPTDPWTGSLTTTVALAAGVSVLLLLSVLPPALVAFVGNQGLRAE